MAPVARESEKMSSSPSPQIQALPPPALLPLTWPAAVVGLMFGVLMTYVPYEFRVASFRPLYPYVRMLGLTYLTGSIMLMGALLYPRAPRWLDVTGRLLLGAAMALYWWVLNVLPGSFTGIILYPVLFGGVVLEAWPAMRQRPVLRTFAALTGAAFGVAMLVVPERFPLSVYAHLAPFGPWWDCSSPCAAWACCCLPTGSTAGCRPCSWAGWRCPSPCSRTRWAGGFMAGRQRVCGAHPGLCRAGPGLATARASHGGVEAAARAGLRGAGAAAGAGRAGGVPGAERD